VTTSIRPGATGAGRTSAAPSAARAAAASTVVGPKSSRKRKVQLVEQTIMVKLIPRTGIFARFRAIVVLAFMAVVMGLVVAGALSVIVWGIATAIHHAAAN
jgi:hypothetical protein